MDRDYLLHRYEEELARARSAKTEEARQAHQQLARHFREAAERLSAPVRGTDTGSGRLGA